MKQLLAFAFVLFILPVWANAAAPADRTFYAQNFNNTNSLAGAKTEGAGTFTLARGENGTPCLSVERPAALGAGDALQVWTLPIAKMRDAKVAFRAHIRAQGIAQPPHFYNGVKFILRVQTPRGTEYPGPYSLLSDFDWQTVTFRAIVPPDAMSATLVLGVEATIGHASFDDVQGRIVARGNEVPPAALTAPIYTGHADVPRLRGAMVPGDIKPEDLAVLGPQWHANLVRYELWWTDPRTGWVKEGWDNTDAYEAWLQGAVAQLDTLLPAFQKNGLRVAVDLHTAPGGTIGIGDWPLFQKKPLQDEFFKTWQMLSLHYKGNKVVWGYDLANEPIEGDVADGLSDWHALASGAAKIVRKNDPAHAIIGKPAPGSRFRNCAIFRPCPCPASCIPSMCTTL